MSEIQSILYFYLPHLAALVKREYKKRDGLPLFGRQKDFLVFVIQVSVLLCTWDGVYLYSQKEFLNSCSYNRNLRSEWKPCPFGSCMKIIFLELKHLLTSPGIHKEKRHSDRQVTFKNQNLVNGVLICSMNISRQRWPE